jgi:glycerol-3-phosphate dehydrogenase
MHSKQYDVVVIGAGIQGAGVAQAASANGYRVLVLEQYSTPAQGTSSRSSKLIHGGLRYLETGQFSLVRECLTERRYLLNNAPHLVKLVPFYIPVYSHSQRSPWTIALGLSLYSLFSFKSFQLIPKSQWDQLDGLQTQELKAVFKYYDGQTDDALLTQAVLASAQSMQATVEFSAEVTSIQVEEEKCTITYTQQGQEKIISSKTVINASGPWVSSLLTRVTPILSSQPSVDLVQGTHIVVPNPSQQRQGMYYLEAPQDQRAIFIMPWKDDQLLIGTTENNYHDDPANVKPLACEIEYLLTVYNHHFSDKLTKQDILSSFSGLRVLPKAKSSAFSRPRDTLIISTDTANPRVLSLYGGKLTAYRATAEQVMKQLKKVLPTVKGHQVIETRSIELRK